MKSSTWVWVAIVAGLVLWSGSAAGVLPSIPMITDKNRLSVTQIYQLALNAGFTSGQAIIATAIALAESGGNPFAHGDTSLGTGTGSFGLWQIYSDAHPEFGPDFDLLYDPQRNADAAYSVFAAAGGSFRPWSTYKSGAYQAHLSTVDSNLTA